MTKSYEKMIGIYKITSPSGRVYIGQSINIEKRLYRYSRIDSNIKGQKRLYRSLKKYGYESHTVEILEECSEAELNVKERFYQDMFNVIGDNGLNCLLTKTNEKKRVMSRDSINKQRLKMLGQKCHLGKKHTQATKDKISKAHKGHKYNVGKKHTPERTKALILCNSKVVLDLATGFFYSSPLEYAILNNINYNTLTCKLSGRLRNNTNLIYA